MTAAGEHPTPGPTIDITIQSPLWNGHDSEATVRRAIAVAATPETQDAELSVLLTDDAEIRTLNAQWRQQDKPTNVLSFPTPDVGNMRPKPLGDIVIAYETTAREAQTKHEPFEHHLSHLTVHGFLHLLGYDHESDDEAETMEQLEREILARLDIADPYATRDEGQRPI